MTNNEQVQNIIRARFPRASRSFIEANVKRIQSAKPQRESPPALVRQISGAKKMRGRITLRYRFCRVRPLDPDNAYGSTKICTDLLCRCGLIPGDDPTQITLQIQQQRVKHFSDERTEVEIVYP